MVGCCGSALLSLLFASRPARLARCRLTHVDDSDTWRASGPAWTVGRYHAAHLRAGGRRRFGHTCCGLCRARIPCRPGAWLPGRVACGVSCLAWRLARLCQPCGLWTCWVRASLSANRAVERRRHSAIPKRPCNSCRVRRHGRLRGLLDLDGSPSPRGRLGGGNSYNSGSCAEVSSWVVFELTEMTRTCAVCVAKSLRWDS